jgi:hypothetical protein
MAQESELPLPQAVQALIDKQAIYEVVLRYCRGVDRGDRELVIAAFHPDAISDHGKPINREQRASGASAAAWDGMMHLLTNVLIELDGDQAYVESYFLSVAVVPVDDERATRVRSGRYLDRFERRDGDWRIAHRVLVDEWSRVDPIQDATPERARLGQRGHEDLVYHIKDFAAPETARQPT